MSNGFQPNSFNASLEIRHHKRETEQYFLKWLSQHHFNQMWTSKLNFFSLSTERMCVCVLNNRIERKVYIEISFSAPYTKYRPNAHTILIGFQWSLFYLCVCVHVFCGVGCGLFTLVLVIIVICNNSRKLFDSLGI